MDAGTAGWINFALWIYTWLSTTEILVSTCCLVVRWFSSKQIEFIFPGREISIHPVKSSSPMFCVNPLGSLVCGIISVPKQARPRAGYMEAMLHLLWNIRWVMPGKRATMLRAPGDSHACVHWAPLPSGSPTPLHHCTPKSPSLQAQSQMAVELPSHPGKYRLKVGECETASLAP